jgi:hypothetical protein
VIHITVSLVCDGCGAELVWPDVVATCQVMARDLKVVRLQAKELRAELFDAHPGCRWAETLPLVPRQHGDFCAACLRMAGRQSLDGKP